MNSKQSVIKIISETNGLSLNNTLELLVRSDDISNQNKKLIEDFQEMLWKFQGDSETIENLLDHPVADAFFHFFKKFSHSLLRGTHSFNWLFISCVYMDSFRKSSQWKR